MFNFIKYSEKENSLCVMPQETQLRQILLLKCTEAKTVIMGF